MSAAAVGSLYEEQLGYYNTASAIRENLNSIKGILSLSLISFEIADRQIKMCEEKVDSARIVIQGFDEYREIIRSNSEVVYKAYDDTDTYIRQLEEAYTKVQNDLETIHKYMVYLNEKFNYGVGMEMDHVYDWEKDYETFSGTIFTGFGDS